MLKITKPQENAQRDIMPHILEWELKKKKKRQNKIEKKKKTVNSHWQRCGEIGILVHCWYKCKQVQSLRKITWRFLKNRTAILSCNENSGYIYPKEFKSVFPWDLVPMFITMFFIIAKIWNQHQCLLIYEWKKKTEYSSTLKRRKFSL